MMPLAPTTIWGDKLEMLDSNGDKNSIFNLRLKDIATDEEKQSFESYAMHIMGGDYFLKVGYPELKDPYYTWEGKVVERSSLNDRELSPV